MISILFGKIRKQIYFQALGKTSIFHLYLFPRYDEAKNHFR
jgi:hypothetical protein